MVKRKREETLTFIRDNNDFTPRHQVGEGLKVSSRVVRSARVSGVIEDDASSVLVDESVHRVEVALPVSLREEVVVSEFDARDGSHSFVGREEGP